MKNAFELAGIQVKKSDVLYFLIGMALPLLLLFLLFAGLKHSGVFGKWSYLTLLLSGKRKLLYYLAVGFVEELLFRGIVFGLLCKKINNILLSILLSAAVFAIPHSVNANIPVYILLGFSFAFGILACEMRCFTKSIWMSSAFHWTWNYSIVSVFMATNTSQFIYGWITIEICALALLFWGLCKKSSAFDFFGE